ncbi:MAG: DUF4132 domain-containing protein [Methylococcales bacterium]|nr:DUF4132 domain-containing protein [Methylococcales bacterium]
MFGILENGESAANNHDNFDGLLSAVVSEINANFQLKFSECEAYNKIKKFTPKQRCELLLYLQQQVIHYYPKAHQIADSWDSSAYNCYTIYQGLFALLMQTKLEFSEDEMRTLFKNFIKNQGIESSKISFTDWPIGFSANQFVKFMKVNEPSDEFIKQMEVFLENKGFQKERLYSGMDVGKARDKMRQSIMLQSGGEITVPPYLADETDAFGIALSTFLKQQKTSDLTHWHSILHHSATAKGAKPKKNWLEQVNSIIGELTAKKYKSDVQNLLESAAKVEIKVETISGKYDAGSQYEYTNSYCLREKNRNVLKGLVWTLIRFYDKKTLQVIARLTEKCFQKMPGVGPAAAGLGNACIYVLAQSKGMEGISHLSRLKLRIRQNNTQKLINNYIEEQATKQGLLASQIEELAAPDFGLVEGERTEAFDDFQLRLYITGIGKAELQWLKPDGKLQKTAPSFVKNNAKQNERLLKFRNLLKQAKQASTAQRDRIDRLYTENRIWTYEEFDKFYFNHGLVSTITRKLIWNLETSESWTPIFWNEKNWQDVSGNTINLNHDSRIRLWHPIDSSSEEVLAWRNLLDSWKIQQPMKQAYREIYLLTDAEINTRIYSNRMASHLLKQHQFNSLAALRGWKYSLQGAYDDGRDSEIAAKKLAAYEITAQFWVYELSGSEEWNDAGIWDYVATDQIRFVNAAEEPIELIDVDKLLLSEIMRDADLFVGVASVGNDPQWQDGGGDPQQREYWQSYSFGDLSEIAKTRKQVLERLLPRLKIRDVAHIKGKFLLIKGKLHSYKIHIGSTNILISPKDQYLCIVAGRSKDKNLQNVFLPFEGDRGLSIVLSKAFLLAADDKIQDKTILSQLLYYRV